MAALKAAMVTYGVTLPLLLAAPALALLLATPASAQDGDVLQTSEQKFFSSPEARDFYAPNVRLRGLYSYLSGLGVQIVAITETAGRYKLIALKSLRYSTEGNNTARCDAIAQPELAQRLIAVWKIMLEQTATPAQPPVMLDGTAYFFSLPDGKSSLNGQTLSPAADTKAATLAALLQAMANFCYSTYNRDDVEKRLSELEMRLQ